MSVAVNRTLYHPPRGLSVELAQFVADLRDALRAPRFAACSPKLTPPFSRAFRLRARLAQALAQWAAARLPPRGALAAAKRLLVLEVP